MNECAHEGDAAARHGGNAAAEFARLGITPREVIDFSVNLSPLGPPEAVLAAISSPRDAVSRYPSLEGDALSLHYARRLGLDPSHILAGNGSTELLYLVPRAIGPARAVVPTPSFADYTRAARLAGACVTWIASTDKDRFAAPPRARLASALSDAQLLFIGNPNNPTGTVYAPDLLLGLAEEFPETYLVVDEAFVDFARDPDSLTLARPDRIRRNILVVRTPTKFFCLPGLRLGAVVGHPDTVGWLRSHKEPWTVNALAERAASALDDCVEYERRLRELIAGERQRVFRRLQSIPLLHAYEPSANFILARWRATGELDDLLRPLMSDGLYVRDCRNFPTLEGSYFRIGIRGREDNDLLLSTIERIAHGHTP